MVETWAASVNIIEWWSKHNNNKKWLFTRVVALYNRLLTTIPLPPVSMFKAQSISPGDRGAYCEHALKAGRSKCSIFVAERPRGRAGSVWTCWQRLRAKRTFFSFLSLSLTLSSIPAGDQLDTAIPRPCQRALNMPSHLSDPCSTPFSALYPLYQTAHTGNLLTSPSWSNSLFCGEKGRLLVLRLPKWDSMRAKSVRRDVTGLTFATYKPWMSHPPKGHNCRYWHIRNPQPAAWRLIQSTSGPGCSSRGRGPRLRREPSIFPCFAR